jgi:hypothetical protein
MSLTPSYEDGIRELARVKYLDRVRRAREQSPIEKLLDGLRLHEYACSITLAGIRNQNPGISGDEAMKILKERVAWKRRQQEIR